MATADEQPALTLTALQQGEMLLLSLTDGRHLAEMSLVPESTALLHTLARAQSDIAVRALTSGRAQGAELWCAYGRELATALLPGALARLLSDAPGQSLSMQLSPTLAALPWEFALDAERLLGESLPVTRQVVLPGDVPPVTPSLPRRGPLKVQILSGETVAQNAAQPLVAQLRALEGVALSAVHVGDLRQEELARLAGYDVLHYIGPVGDDAGVRWMGGEALDLGLLAAALPPSTLLLVQPTGGSDPADFGSLIRLAVGASRAGAAALLLRAAPAGEALDFTVAFYEALRQGGTLAASVRDARVALHRSLGLSALARLRPELYGDGQTVLYGPARWPRADDVMRQVTAMSIDLVGSTRLLNALGAERYSELLAQHHHRAAEILRARGGVPDAPQGDDGGMCYFGLPMASEGAAASALRAGFELIEAVQSLGLSVRIGVCTGEVIVRDGLAVGPAIHLAARLQSIAAPGTMVVGESTRRIVKDRFRFQRVEVSGQLKGIDHPEACYRAVAMAEDNPGAAAAVLGGRPTPFVGRHAERQALVDHWRAARAGEFRLVRIVGEAGIGKSRLVREIKRTLAEERCEILECRCAPEHVNSAFHPIIEGLRGELRIEPGEDPITVRERLRVLVAGAEAIDDDCLALLADLLRIEMPERHPALDMPADQRRRVILRLLVALARQRMRNACMVLEDVHWIDPSTAEFVNRFATEARSDPMLLIVTGRSETESAWHPRARVHEMELRGLVAEQARALAIAACGERQLPPEVLHLIAARADGVPLFIEESARMALEQGQFFGGATLQPAQVPGTILDLLTARLDRLGSAKLVAQVGAAIGREFPLALIEAVLRHPGSPVVAQDLEARLETLQRSGMLMAVSDASGPRFGFKHALMRDAAYGSLLARDRPRLHQVIATVIATQFAALGQREPELLAYHHAQAGNDGAAVRCWEAAARLAASRSEQLEALAHVQSAIDVLMRMPADTARDRQELKLRLLLAARLIATHGYGADRVEQVYGRARELALALGDATALRRVLLGLEGYHFMRADFAKAQDYVLEAAGHAGADEGGIQRVQTLWALANARMHQGEMAWAVERMDECLALYERLEHRPDAVQDPGVMCLCYSGWSKWQLGYPDQALERVQRVVQLAERLQHKFSLGEAYGFRAAVQHFRGENRDALASAEQAIRICEEAGFAVWLAHARVLRGRALAELGEGPAGVEEMRRGFELWASTGAVVTTPFYLTMRAEGLALCGRQADALVLLRQALAIVERHGERYYESEIRRLIGRLLWLQAGADAAVAGEAEVWLLQALHCAQSRGMKLLALRAARDLAELCAAQGRVEEGIALLQPADASITEGRGTADLVASARLMGALCSELEPPG